MTTFPSSMESDLCCSAVVPRGCVSARSLPDSCLRDIGEYLETPSRAIMAAAFSRPACFDSDTLDFGYSCFSRELAWKLTDDDLESMLISIDAVTRLKVLKLTGCEKITGTGLKPLMGSVVLKQIDLSTSCRAVMAGSDELFLPNFPWRFNLEENVVIPILDSIIAAKGTALKHVQLPMVWRENKSAKLTAFLGRFDETLCRRPFTCVECDSTHTANYWIHLNSSLWGQQNKICFDCTKNFCITCEPGFCRDCNKQFCDNCCDKKKCDSCSSLVCERCEDIDPCEQCGDIFCENCMQTLLCECCDQFRCLDCVDHNFCARCGDSNCGECANQDNVQWCEICEWAHCNDCRLELWFLGRLDCLGCRGLLLPRIMLQNEVLSSENEMMKDVAQKILHKLAPLADDPDALLCDSSGNDVEQDDPL